MSKVKQHTILSPLVDGGVIEITGRKVLLQVAGTTVPFLIYLDQNLHNRLAHYASGRNVCHLRPSLDHRFLREYAQAQIVRIEEEIGAATVLDRLQSAEVIN